MNSATWNSQPDACAATTAGAQGPDRITRTGYDAVGRVETVTTGYGVDPIVATAATFTDNGRLATLTDGGGNRTDRKSVVSVTSVSVRVDLVGRRIIKKHKNTP